MKIKILIPVYNDFQSLSKLIININSVISNLNAEFSIIIINDSSTEKAEIDISNLEDISSVFKEYQPQIVVNLAAQAGVRYSIKNPYAYMESNLVGFLNIIELCRHNDVKGLIVLPRPEFCIITTLFLPASHPPDAIPTASPSLAAPT